MDLAVRGLVESSEGRRIRSWLESEVLNSKHISIR